MVLDRRNLHLRLQEYCDCYMDTDPKRELEAISKWGSSSDVTRDSEEVGVKFLGLSILYGLKESASKISISKGRGGDVQMNVEAAGKYKLPAPPSTVAEQAFKAMRAITHLESQKAREPLSLGLRNDRLELGVEFDDAGDRETLSILFPKM